MDTQQTADIQAALEQTWFSYLYRTGRSDKGEWQRERSMYLTYREAELHAQLDIERGHAVAALMIEIKTTATVLRQVTV